MQLRVATLNAWALPDPFGKKVPERMRAVGERCADLELDVFCLQEVWTADAREILLRAGRRAGLAHAWHNQATLRGSGLLVLSRLPIEAVRFERFALPGLPTRPDHADYYGRKGFAVVRVTTPTGPLNVVDTHLHARYGSDVPHEYRAYRVGQIVQLAMNVARRPEPLVAVGDLNFVPEDPEYAVWTGLTASRDAARAAGREETTANRSSPYRGSRKPDRRIDYVFVRDGEAQGVRVRDVRVRFDRVFSLAGRPASYSDHAGVVADLELGPAAGVGLPQPDPEAARLAARMLASGRARAESRRGRDRMLAGAGMAAGLIASAGLRDQRLTRRRLLRGAIQGAGILALTPCVGSSIVSEFFAPDELRAFERLANHLERLGGPSGDEIA